MGDYFDEDVTEATSEELGALVKLRLRRFPTVQLFKKSRRTILRTWRIEFDVQGAEGETIER